jgi:branched-chain amino acid transport system substrate-binding protein
MRKVEFPGGNMPYWLAKATLRLAAIVALTLEMGLLTAAARAETVQPIKVGLSTQLTGPLAGNGKQILLTAQIWTEAINAKGGLLGRPVELVYYDDQSLPANVPGIYAKLIDIDKVDALFSVATNLTAAAMPFVIQHGKLIISIASLGVNKQFNYDRYFQIVPFGPDGKSALSRGFFDVAMTMTPPPNTVALVGADAEFSKTALDGARAHAAEHKLDVVFDRGYPPGTVDFLPIVRSIKAASPELVFVASYPLDTVGMLVAVSEIGLDAKMVGGALVGLSYTAVKSRLGEKLNGVITYSDYVPAPTLNFPGIEAFLATYQKRAADAGIDPLGHEVPPYAYAGLEALGQSMIAAGSTDPEKVARQMHRSVFKTVVGEVTFGSDGEWAKPRLLTIQFQNVRGNGIEQFNRAGTMVILDPPQYKSGELKYPFAAARE